MPLLVQCPCGQPLRARDEDAGRAVLCPTCRRAVPVPPAAGAPSATPSGNYHVLVGGRHLGPFAEARLAAAALAPGALVWRPGLDGWARPSELEELAPLLAPAAAHAGPHACPPARRSPDLRAGAAGAGCPPGHRPEGASELQGHPRPPGRGGSPGAGRGQAAPPGDGADKGGLQRGPSGNLPQPAATAPGAPGLVASGKPQSRAGRGAARGGMGGLVVIFLILCLLRSNDPVSKYVRSLAADRPARSYKDLSSAVAEIDGVPVTAEGLCRELRSNEVAANWKYRGKVLDVTGRVTRVSAERKGLLGGPTVVCLEGGAPGVRCEFQSDDEVVDLAMGQVVTIRGKYREGGAVAHCTVRR